MKRIAVLVCVLAMVLIGIFPGAAAAAHIYPGPDDYSEVSSSFEGTTFVLVQSVHFTNFGVDPAFNVTASVDSTPEYVVASDPDVTIGDLPSMAGASSQDTFEIRVDTTGDLDPAVDSGNSLSYY